MELLYVNLAILLALFLYFGIRKTSKLKHLVIILVVLLCADLAATIPVHYRLDSKNNIADVFAKDHFTFNHTFITEADVDAAIQRYNDGNLIEKSAMQNDEFIKTLIEHGILVKKDE